MNSPGDVSFSDGDSSLSMFHLESLPKGECVVLSSIHHRMMTQPEQQGLEELLSVSLDVSLLSEAVNTLADSRPLCQRVYSESRSTLTLVSSVYLVARDVKPEALFSDGKTVTIKTETFWCHSRSLGWSSYNSIPMFGAAAAQLNSSASSLCSLALQNVEINFSTAI